MARGKAREEPAQGGGTTVMFLALMIILLAFFIMLVAMSTIEERKVEDVLASIYSTFGFMPGGSSPLFSPGGVSSRASSPMTPLEADFQEIKKLAYQTLGRDKVRLFIERHRRTISVDREILFDPESVKLKPEAERFLKGLAAIIEAQKYSVTVNGHTDDIPPAPGGSVTNNWALSGLRAVDVVKFLIEHKIAPQRLAAYGYGPTRPLRPNTSADNRAMNHRVDIVLDESLAGPVSDLKVREAPGKIRYKGFTFDILGQ